MAENVDRLSELGERYLVAGDAAGLAAVKKKLAEMKTDRPAALLALGRLLHSEEKDADAAVTLEEALALRPNDFDTERELGAVYNAVGQYEKASFIMKKALKQRPQGDGLTLSWPDAMSGWDGWRRPKRYSRKPRV